MDEHVSCQHALAGMKSLRSTNRLFLHCEDAEIRILTETRGAPALDASRSSRHCVIHVFVSSRRSSLSPLSPTGLQIDRSRRPATFVCRWPRAIRPASLNSVYEKAPG